MPSRRNQSKKKPLRLEVLERRDLLAADWQNPGQPLDVNDDLYVTPIDVLLLVNKLNSQSPELPESREPQSDLPYYDVNGDGVLAPIDVLLAVNALNANRPVATIRLVNDTGVPADNVTSVGSIEGVVSIGDPTGLWLQINDSSWFDVAGRLQPDGSYELPEWALETFAGELLRDGGLRLSVRTTPPEGLAVDAASLDVEIDQTRLRARTGHTIVMREPGKIVVPFVDPAQPLPVNLSEIDIRDVTGTSVSSSARVQPIAARVVPGSYALEIDIPAVTMPRTYRVQVTGAVSDLAGNPGEPISYEAHYFDSTDTVALPMGERVAQFFSSERSVEYSIDIAEPDVLIWAGSSSDAVVFELFDPSGVRMDHRFDGPPGAAGTDGVMFHVLDIPGRYVLRLTSPELGGAVGFRMFLASQLEDTSEGILEGDLRGWEYGIHRIDTSKVDGLYIHIPVQSVFDVYCLDANGGILGFGGGGGRSFLTEDRIAFLAIRNAEHRESSYTLPFNTFTRVDESVPLGTWLDAAAMPPGASATYRYDVADDQLVAMEYRPGAYQPTERGPVLRLPLHGIESPALSRLVIPGEATISYSKSQVDADFRVRFRDASHPAELPIDLDVAMPAYGEVQVFRFTTDQPDQTLQLTAQSSIFYVYQQLERELRELERLSHTHTATSARGVLLKEPGEYFIVAAHFGSFAPAGESWRAQWVDTEPYDFRDVESVPRDDVFRKPFEREFPDRRYEYVFEIDALVNDVYRLEFPTLQGQIGGRFSVIDDNGDAVLLSRSWGEAATWFVPHSGKQRIEFSSTSSRPETLQFDLVQLHQADLLPPLEPVVKELAFRDTWILRPDVQLSERADHVIFAQANSSMPGATWYAINNRAEVVSDIKPVEQPLEFVSEGGLPVWIIVDGPQSTDTAEVSVVWNATAHSTQPLLNPLGSDIQRRLAELGDSVTYELPLEAGQTLEFESFSSTGPVHVYFDGKEIKQFDSVRLDAFRSRNYALRIVSKHVGENELSFRLRAGTLAPKLLADGDFVGFNSLIEGELDAPTKSFEFSVPAGAFVAVDWHADSPLLYEIETLSGVLLRSDHGDSPMFELPEAGSYKIRVSGPVGRRFSFTLRTPSLSDWIELDEIRDIELSGGEFRFLRANIEKPTELFLDAPEATGVAYFAAGEQRFLPFAYSRESRHLEGDVILRVNGQYDRNSIQVRLVDSQTRAGLLFPGRTATVSTTPGVTSLFPVVVGRFDTPVRAWSSDASVFIDPSLGGNFAIQGGALVGDYTLRVTPVEPDANNATIDVEAWSAILEDLELNTEISRNASRGEVHRFEVDVLAGKTLFLSDQYSYFEYEWIGPNGYQYSSDFGILQAEASGIHTLVIRPQHNGEYRFRVQDSVPTIEPGLHQIDFDTGVRSTIRRVAGQPGEVYRIGRVDEGSLRVIGIHGQEPGQEWTPSGTVIASPDSGEFFLYLEPRQSGRATFVLEKQSKHLVDVAFEQTYSAEVDGFSTHEFRFTVKSGGHSIRIQLHSDNSLWTELHLPQELRYINETVADTFLPAGDYAYEITNDRGPNRFRFTISTMATASEVSVGEPTVVQSFQYHRLNIPTDGEYAVSIVDPLLGAPDEVFDERLNIENLNDTGSLWEPAPGRRLALAAGDYWVWTHGGTPDEPAQRQVSVEPVYAIIREATVGDEIAFDLGQSGFVDQHIRLAIPRGAYYAIDLSASSGQQVWIRYGDSIGSNWGELDVAAMWSPAYAWQEAEAEIRILGKGSGSIRILDLHTAPVLNVGDSVSQRLEPGYHIAMWQINADDYKSYTIRPSADTNIRYWLVLAERRRGLSEELGSDELRFSQSTNSRLTLLVFADESVESPLLEFELLEAPFA